MHRRTFIKNGCLACAGVVLAGGVLPGCGSAHYAVVAFNDQRLIIKRSEFAQTKKGATVFRLFVVLKHEMVEFPIALYRFGDDDFVALYLQCTHQGCELRPQATLLTCPCHDSEFDLQGKVLGGPAERDLKQFRIKTDPDNIYISLI